MADERLDSLTQLQDNHQYIIAALYLQTDITWCTMRL